MIKLDGISLNYGETCIFDNTTLSLQNGKITAIIGKSGAGKTALLYMVGLLGNIYPKLKYTFNDRGIKATSQKQASLFRKHHIGYVFQENNTLEHLTIYQNFELVCSLVGKECTLSIVEDLMNTVRLTVNVDGYPKYLSGGQRQRLCIALALCKGPNLIILDEPTSNLDEENARNILLLLKEIAVSQNKMILIATHSKDVVEISDVCYEINQHQLMLIKGKIDTNTNKEQKNNATNRRLFSIKNIQYYFKFNFKSYLLLCLICMFGVNLIVGSVTVGHQMISSQKEVFNHEFNHEIFILSQKGDFLPRYYSFLKSMSDEEISLIEKISGIENVYPYIELNVDNIVLDDKVIEGQFVIQPYFEESNVEYNGNQAYIERRIYDKIEPQSILISSQENRLSFTVGGRLSALEQNNYSSASGWLIKVPYLQFSEIHPSKNQALVCFVDHYEDLEEIIKEVNTINNQLLVRADTQQAEMFNIMIDDYKNIILILSVVIGGVVELLLWSTYRKLISTRKEEFCLLKANGLSNMELYLMLLLESLVVIGATSGLSIAIFIILSIFIKCSIGFYFSSIFLISFVTLNIAILTSIRRWLLKSPASLLRE